MAIVYDDILEAVMFRRMDTASDENLERLLHIYFNDHDLYLSAEELRCATIRYRVFGRKMFSVYGSYLMGSYRRTHEWFLIEVANNAIIDIAPTGRIFKRMMDNENIDWQKVYAYYDMIGRNAFGRGAFGELALYLEKYRDELLPPPYDMI